MGMDAADKANLKLRILSAGVLIPAAVAEDRHDKIEKQDMRQAIQFERQKEQAAARQARIERRGGGEQARARNDRKTSADRAAPGDSRHAAKPEKQAPR